MMKTKTQLGITLMAVVTAGAIFGISSSGFFETSLAKDTKAAAKKLTKQELCLVYEQLAATGTTKEKDSARRNFFNQNCKTTSKKPKLTAAQKRDCTAFAKKSLAGKNGFDKAFKSLKAKCFGVKKEVIAATPPPADTPKVVTPPPATPPTTPPPATIPPAPTPAVTPPAPTPSPTPAPAPAPTPPAPSPAPAPTPPPPPPPAPPTLNFQGLCTITRLVQSQDGLSWSRDNSFQYGPSSKTQVECGQLAYASQNATPPSTPSWKVAVCGEGTAGGDRRAHVRLNVGLTAGTPENDKYCDVKFPSDSSCKSNAHYNITLAPSPTYDASTMNVIDPNLSSDLYSTSMTCPAVPQ